MNPQLIVTLARPGELSLSSLATLLSDHFSLAFKQTLCYRAQIIYQKFRILFSQIYRLGQTRPKSSQNHPKWPVTRADCKRVATPVERCRAAKVCKSKTKRTQRSRKKLKQHCTRYILYFQRLKPHSQASAEGKRSAKVPASSKFSKICSLLCITAAKSVEKILQEPKKTKKFCTSSAAATSTTAATPPLCRQRQQKGAAERGKPIKYKKKSREREREKRRAATQR